MTMRLQALSFARQAGRILGLNVAHRVNRLGGYGAGGEVIYEAHPLGCPATLVTNRDNAKATFMSNGSIAFEVKLENGMDIQVLSGSFDATEKRETNVPSGNLWLVPGKSSAVAALINPNAGTLAPRALKVVKLGDPGRAMWYCASFARGGTAFQTAVKLSLAGTPHGPALLREVFIENTGRRRLQGLLWAFFNLHGTQRFVYNKEIWYDSGLAVTPAEIVVAATVPYSDILQLKRLSSVPGRGLSVLDATCDYSAFVGDSAALSLLPLAVRRGTLAPAGAGSRLNRFTIATIAAGQFALDLAPGRAAELRQSVLYVTDAALLERFRQESSCQFPDYKRVAQAFLGAAKELVKGTPEARRISAQAAASAATLAPPAFELVLPKQRVISEYAKSVWIGVEELYENCRAHGAKLANGIELGTRDRAQDMWPKMKQDPGRVRADLVHALSFMYVTVGQASRLPLGALASRRPVADPACWSQPLTRTQKLHGMFPRQYPSRWDDRSQEVLNDNRPYADSPLWLLDAVNMYVRETGDSALLLEKVQTVRLTNPDKPESSGIAGCDKTFCIAEVLLEVLECFQRHIQDSPYGLAQIMYGDWCDPVDMFGTAVAGDASTRGQGRGAQVRLSAHVGDCMVQTIDLLETRRAREALAGLDLAGRIQALKRAADQLRKNIVRVAWEPGLCGAGILPAPGSAGVPPAPGAFLSAIHELNRDGSRPDYARGETGYTLGSMRGRDFDGVNRRELLTQAYCLKMLLTEREYLEPIPDSQTLIRELLATSDELLFDERLGLRLFNPPIANNKLARELVGRMGVVPAGCAENGEYHHAQVMMHRHRLAVPGQAGRAWEQFKRIVSAARDESLAGPFEMPCTSYASDRDDPHYGKGMYFGLSGSADWIIEFFQALAGLKLSLHDNTQPALQVTPLLPAELGETLTFRRSIHLALPTGGYRRIPFELNIKSEGKGDTLRETLITINGKRAEAAEVRSLENMQRVDMAITYRRGQ
ncbi:MAG: hypothetical protein ABSE73_01995 [Planctomycetota bacterium]